MSNTTEKAEPNERQSKSKGETGRPTLSERQGTTGRRKEKDGEKAKKESTNPEAKDPHTRYFTRLGIVHKTEAQSRSLARHSVHVGPYNRHAVKGKPRRGGSVLASSAHATDPVREGGGGRTQRDPLPPAGLLVDGACAQPPVSGESCHDLPSMERAPATTETHRGGGAGADLSTTGSDLGSGAPTGGGIVRSASTQALWTPSGDRTDAQQQLLRREKWFSLTEFPPSSILSPNRFSTGLEQIQNETASVKAGLLVEPGVSMVHVPRPRVRSSSQPPKSEYKVAAVTQPTSSSSHIPTIPEEKDYFQVTSELDRENLHFSLSEAILTAIEKYKSNLIEQQVDSLGEELDSLGEELDGNSLYDSHNSPSSQDNLHDNGEASEQHPEDIRTGEEAARKLFLFLAGHQPRDVQPYKPVLNYLQLPLKLVVSLSDDEQLLKSLDAAYNKRSNDWSPPQAKVLLEVFSAPKNFEQAIIAQGYRCTGCGMTLDSNYSRYFRFCHYTGKYFCQNCHISSLCVVPAYVLEYWSFKKLPVSNFARDLLSKIYYDPVFKVTSRVCTKIAQLSAARDLRIQLISVKKYLRSCKDPSAQGLNRTYDGYIPWTTDTLHYSMDDFMQVKVQGMRMKHLRSMLADGVRHIKSCQSCLGKGFVCEFCKNDQDILFPFELEKVAACRDCMCCYHKTCFTGKECPKCTRLQRRRTVLMSDDDTCDITSQSQTIAEESCDLSHGQ